MNGTRERIVGATADLMRRQGYEATGIKEIVAAAGAPFGSIYHFFPGGKEQLGAETIRWSGGMYALLLPAVFDPAPDLPTGVRTFFSEAAKDLEASGYVDACPIATVALEVSSQSEPLREACAEVFEGWITGGTRYFARDGLDEATARKLVITLISALEGAFVLCRASRTTEALLVAGEAVATTVERALAESRSG